MTRLEKILTTVVAGCAITLVTGLVVYGISQIRTESEAAPVNAMVDDHEVRIIVEEQASAEIAEKMETQNVQNAQVGRKVASRDLRELSSIPKAKQYDGYDEEVRQAELRLQFNQKIIDSAMGMPDE